MNDECLTKPVNVPVNSLHVANHQLDI